MTIEADISLKVIVNRFERTKQTALGVHKNEISDILITIVVNSNEAVAEKHYLSHERMTLYYGTVNNNNTLQLLYIRFVKQKFSCCINDPCKYMALNRFISFYLLFNVYRYRKNMLLSS